MLLKIKLFILPDRVETTIAAIPAAANKTEAIFMYVALVITISLAFDCFFLLVNRCSLDFSIVSKNGEKFRNIHQFKE